ncbi:MAG: DUF6677 family protein [Planctomycetota bacterium]
MAFSDTNHLTRITFAGFLAWLVPGLGHLYLGERHRGLTLLVVIAATFWGGVAMGGVVRTVEPQHRTAWFMAQLGTGGHTLAVLGWKQALKDAAPVYSWQAEDVAIVYTGVAGLLNLLVIIDAMARADGGARAAARAGPAARTSRGGT